MKPFRHQLLLVAAGVLSTLTAGAQRVEYFWDDDPGVGRGRLLQTFAGTSGTLTAQLDASSLAVGIHQLGLRALNGIHHSATYYRSFLVPAPQERITAIEYGWDQAPSPGCGTPITFTPGSTVNLSEQLSVAGLSEGIHTLHVRALTEQHVSHTYARTFYIYATPRQMTAIEYFFDTDPGVGHATRMSATQTADSLRMAFALNTGALSEGVHRLGLRVLTGDTWSSTRVRQFLVQQFTENHVVRLEYFWDEDPGAGQGYVVDITPGHEVTADFEADMFGLGEGSHTLGLRAMSGSRAWSQVKQVTDIAFEGWDELQDYLNSLRDTEDLFSAGAYTRQFLNKEWQALYVPFTLSYSQWADHFDVARINAFYQYDDDDDGVVDRQVLEAIMVRPGNGSLRANYPYLIRPKTTGTFVLGIDADRVSPQQVNSYSCSTMEARYTFTGNYDHLTGLHSAGRYRLRGGTLSLPDSDDEVLPPFRWYLTIDNLGNQLEPSASRIALRVVSDDGATAIGSALTPDDDGAATQVFDLQGRRVDPSRHSSLRKGVYIVDGKKRVRH